VTADHSFLPSSLNTIIFGTAASDGAIPTKSEDPTGRFGANISTTVLPYHLSHAEVECNDTVAADVGSRVRANLPDALRPDLTGTWTGTWAWSASLIGS